MGRCLLSRELARAKERYQANALEAYRSAARNLIPHIHVDFHVTGWTGRGVDAYRHSWKRRSKWDWEEIFRRHREPDCLEMAVWSENSDLCALGLGLTSGRAVELRFLEGNGQDGCPLVGRRALIALETVSCYAQLMGKREVWVNPINEQTTRLYVDEFGFERVVEKGRTPFFRRYV